VLVVLQIQAQTRASATKQAPMDNGKSHHTADNS
jgi:hypothetical protein